MSMSTSTCLPSRRASAQSVAMSLQAPWFSFRAWEDAVQSTGAFELVGEHVAGVVPGPLAR